MFLTVVTPVGRRLKAPRLRRLFSMVRVGVSSVLTMSLACSVMCMLGL